MAAKKSKPVKLDTQAIWRVIDANANRAREGLRVVEDTARFVLNREDASNALRDMRHRLDSIVRHYYSKLLQNRDVEHDLGRSNGTTDHKSGLPAILASNFKRCTEAMRVMEEYSRVVAPRAVRGIQAIRYGIYQWEKKLLA